MNHVVKKIYVDYEKEEVWLNEMCSKGYALIDYTRCKYTFEECKPNSYTYRLEMLENHSDSLESKKYIKFLEETGVEHVASYIRWVFLRKKKELGPFVLFTDFESKLKHHKRIALFLGPVALLNLVIGLVNLFNPVLLVFSFRVVISSIHLILGGFVGFHVIRHLRKVAKQIYES